MPPSLTHCHVSLGHAAGLAGYSTVKTQLYSGAHCRSDVQEAFQENNTGHTAKQHDEAAGQVTHTMSVVPAG
jgi:hypothetical protein